MSDVSLAERVATAPMDPDEFAARVEADAAALKAALADGSFDNPQSIVGLEYEFYGVDPETAALRRIPRQLLEYIGFEGELGLHNAEMQTSPQPCNRFGLRCQESEVQARLDAAQRRAEMAGIRLVSDGFFTVPPTGEQTHEYLDGWVEDDGVRLATNMSKSVRYHAMTNAPYDCDRRIETPHVTLESETVLPESLTTSIQPHYQVPHAEDLPTYHRYAIRLAGPLLALGVNSPFFPPDLYDEDATDPASDLAHRVLADGWAENRIPVFEGIFNPADDREGKVRFPRDVETVDAAADRLVTDPAIVPMSVDPTGRFDDQFAHLRHKHGSYWRWIRPVFDGATPSAANARLEFRPIAAQPTVRDSVAFLATFAGLMESCFHFEHPIEALPWDLARENFYAAMRDGLNADLHWITANGDSTTDTERLFAELFEAAKEGLELRDVPSPTADRYLRPLVGRVRHGVTPAEWKREQVRERVEAGHSLAEAIEGMQRAYVDRQAETLLTGTFLEWLPEGN